VVCFLFFKILKKGIQGGYKDMARDTLNRKYINVVLDLESMTLTEMPKKKDDVEREFDLMTELARFAGDDRRVDITFAEVSDHLPNEEE
jgi:hypothetical protein